MYYRSLGNTGKQVSVIGFGGMRFKAEDYKNGPEKCAEIVLRAQELGINYFDTAPDYCNGYSETIVGHAFKQMKKKPYVSTKCALWNAETSEDAYKRIYLSLEKLNVEKITFYNLWGIKTLDEYRQMIKPNGILDGICKAKEEGLIEHICCTTHIDSLGLSEIVADGLVESVTLGYNAINFAYRREGLKTCYKAGLGVIIMNPLGGGVIPRHAEMFSFIKSNSDESVVKAALRFLIGQREISVALPGPSCIVELEECVAAADKEYVVTEEMLTTLSGKLRSELDMLCTGCAYCNVCPQNIPIPQMMDAYNAYLLEGGFGKVRERLLYYWGINAKLAGRCIKCGKCQERCTQKLPIIERLESIRKKSKLLMKEFL